MLGLVIVGLVLVGAGGFMFLLRQDSGDDQQAEIDDLLDAIAELDEQHQQGILNHDYYKRHRSELKEQLADLMRQQAADGEPAAEDGDVDEV